MSDQTRSVFVVTGAGGAVGGALARQLAEAGCRLMLTSRTERKLEAVLGELDPDTAAGRAADLTDEAAARGVVDAAVERFGRVDGVAHVAGNASLVPVERITMADWRATIDTNVSALLTLVAAAWPHFRRQRGGRVAAVSSMASLDPFPGFSLYAPAKAAENTFIDVVGKQGAELGVEAVSVAPGAIETPMLRSLFDEATIPRDRTLAPETVAALVRDCLLGDRAFRSGETIEMPSG